MSKSQTIRELVAELSAIPDQDQPVICAYWLTENFEFEFGDVKPTQEQFAEAIEDLETTAIFDEPSQIINDFVFDVVSSQAE
jgi:hypothetical protein